MISYLEGLKNLGGPRAVSRKTPRKTGTSFQEALHETAQTETASEASSVSMASLISPFLAPYPHSEAASPHERFVDQGRAWLQKLEALRNGLLTGQYTLQDLHALKQSLEHSPAHASLPQELRDLLKSIRLRVAVEYEKFRRS